MPEVSRKKENTNFKQHQQQRGGGEQQRERRQKRRSDQLKNEAVVGLHHGQKIFSGSSELLGLV